MKCSENDLFVTFTNDNMKYEFKENIDIVFNFFKDESKQLKAIPEYRTKAIYINGQSSYELNAEFIINWKQVIAMRIKVLEVISEPNYKMIKYRINISIPYQMHYEYTYHFYKCTLDNSTLLKWNFYYPEGLTINKEDLKKCKAERDEILKIFDNYLIKNNKCVQRESVLINRRAENVFKIVSDWVILQQLVPSVCDEIFYNGPSSSIGSIMIMKWNNENRTTFELKVTKCELKDTEYKYELSCLESLSRCPIKKIIFKVIELDHICYLQFKHVYNKNFDSKAMMNISFQKQKMIEQICHKINCL